MNCRYFTLLHNNRIQIHYLISNDLDFNKIYFLLSSIKIEDSYLNLILLNRNKRKKEIVNLLNQLKIDETNIDDEDKWVFTWIKIVNKLLPDANVCIEEYCPLSL